MLGIPFHKPTAEARQDRVMEAGVVKLEPEQVLEVDSASYGISNVTVRKSFGELYDGNERQAPRCLGRLPYLWKEVGEHLVVEDGAQLISERHVAVALRKGSLGYAGGLF